MDQRAKLGLNPRKTVEWMRLVNGGRCAPATP
jgi:hypothetical protein